MFLLWQGQMGQTDVANRISSYTTRTAATFSLPHRQGKGETFKHQGIHRLTFMNVTRPWLCGVQVPSEFTFLVALMATSGWMICMCWMLVVWRLGSGHAHESPGKHQSHLRSQSIHPMHGHSNRSVVKGGKCKLKFASEERKDGVYTVDFLFTTRAGGVTGPRAPQSGFAFYIMRYFCLVLGTASSSCIFLEGALSFISFLN